MDNRSAEQKEDTHKQEDFALVEEHQFHLSIRQEHLRFNAKHYFQSHSGLSISQFT